MIKQIKAKNIIIIILFSLRQKTKTFPQCSIHIHKYIIYLFIFIIKINLLLNKITKYEINIKSFKRIKSIKINLEN